MLNQPIPRMDRISLVGSGDQIPRRPPWLKPAERDFEKNFEISRSVCSGMES